MAINENNKNFIMFCAIALISCLTLFAFGQMYESMQTTEYMLKDFVYLVENYEMYNKKIADKVTINGLYHHKDDFYCVWVKERDPVSISKTEAHEYCHHLIETGEKNHFCGIDGTG